MRAICHQELYQHDVTFETREQGMFARRLNDFEFRRSAGRREHGDSRDAEGQESYERNEPLHSSGPFPLFVNAFHLFIRRARGILG